MATLIFTPLGILLFPLPLNLRFRIMKQWAVFNLWWLKVCCGITHEVKGRENMIDGPAIIMCKHQSAWETLALQVVFPPQVWVLKRELLWIPIYGWGLASMQPIAIDRSSNIRAFKQIVEQGMKRLQKGLWIVVFPEGTRVRAGDRGNYQPGGGLLAEKSAYPVVPVTHNAGYLWPRKSLVKYPGRITMVIGPAIETRGKKAKQITRDTEQWIESNIPHAAQTPGI
ncbi:MAG: 1-acyl-sn-glycerol-3-phosphate acyltransferase [Thiotrichales bacterium]|nr:1-acyl-sn-glycerol-3-phosphate acyltransferase [Thiotrichales bacterium]